MTMPCSMLSSTSFSMRLSSLMRATFSSMSAFISFISFVMGLSSAYFVFTSLPEAPASSFARFSTGFNTAFVASHANTRQQRMSKTRNQRMVGSASTKKPMPESSVTPMRTSAFSPPADAEKRTQ